MKKHLLLALMCLMGIGGVQKAYAVKQIYALKAGDRMTIYYDENKGNYPNNPLYQWNNTSLGAEGIDQNVLNEITTVIFHSSMKDARPISTERWFQDLRNLDEIYFLDYLNTSEVTDMSQMFYNCESLNTLDVSKFNTENVWDMSGMFYGCESLRTLDVSKFNTSKVTKMGWMFDGCSSLESLDVTKFNTENVTWMNFMFAECYSLNELDLTNFNTENVKYMNNMFEGDSLLTTIYCNRDWSASTVLESSTNMFTGCTSLVGVNGTAYDANVIDITYARPDKAGQPGYFTVPKRVYTYWNAGSHTLAYFYDNMYQEAWVDPETVHFYTPDNQSDPYGIPSRYRDVVTGITIDQSMQEIALLSMRNMFYSGVNQPNLTYITGLENLNTSEVTNMAAMFYGCEAVTSLDLSHFNTSKVTAMNTMFYNCKALINLDISSFNTENVRDMAFMFYECNALPLLDLHHFNTNQVGRMLSMFAYCSSLSELNLSGWDISNVATMDNMFNNCTALQTIYCNTDWSSSTASSIEMFKKCNVLKGGNGTTYNANKTDITYARPDDPANRKPGYFTVKDMQGVEVTPSDSPSRGEKILRDGKLYIVVGEKMYDAHGVEVK